VVNWAKTGIWLTIQPYFREDNNNIVISQGDLFLRKQRGEKNAGLKSVRALMCAGTNYVNIFAP